MSKKWQKIIISGICILLALLMALSLILSALPAVRADAPETPAVRIAESDLWGADLAG